MNEELQKGNSVFLIELDKIEVNPYQPRIEFNEEKIKALAESIKQYGIIQPIVVSRKEEYSEEFGIRTKYQIIAGERRFRASKLIGLKQIPAIIRNKEDTDAEKLELAIIENLQREDLNPVDKARAFRRLADDFGLKHAEIAKKMGKSREYVSNAMRILMLPENILSGLTSGKISEGHTRSLLMLKDRPQEQIELYKRIVEDKLTVRSAEKLARNIAVDKIRKKVDLDPEIKDIENHIREKLGTKVSIDQKPIGDGGKLTIEFFNKNDLRKILSIIESESVVEDFNVLKTEDNSFVENSESEVNNFEDIQPTIFKEEIDKIEQFANTKNDMVAEKIDSTGFQGFSIGENIDNITPENEKKEESNDLISDNVINNNSEKINNDLDMQNGVEVEDNKFLNTKADEIEGVINNFENFSMESDIKDEVSDNSQLVVDNKKEEVLSNYQNDIQSEINSELEKINNFSNPNDNIVSSGNEIKKVDGLERVEIKNDFDRTRIDAFAKTDEILKSFNKEPKIVSENNVPNEYNDTVLKDANTGTNINEVVNDTSLEQEKNNNINDNSQDEYSDLYAEFLKSKNSVENGGVNTFKNNEPIDSLENEFKIDSADNILIQKESEDLSKNIISDANNTYLDSKVEDIDPVVNIITQDSSDFLAAAEEHKNNSNDVIKVDDEKDSVDSLEKDDKYSFKGFSL